MSATAARRPKRSPTRSSRAPRRSTATASSRVREVDIDSRGTFKVGDTTVEVIDPVADYAALMESLFDFDAIRAMFAGGFTMVFDAMHAVTGPYATEIIEATSRRAQGHGSRQRAAAGFRRPPPRPEPGPRARTLRTDDVAQCAGFRRGVRRRRRPQPDHRQGHFRQPVRFAGAAGRQCASGAWLQRRSQGHRPLHADQRGGRPCRRSARHRHV